MDPTTQKIHDKFIRKSSAPVQKKMRRNLQPEIEKLKSISMSLRGMYINDQELDRLKNEIENLLITVEACGKN